LKRGYHPKNRLEKVEELTLAANEYRKNLIKLMMGEPDAKPDEILAQVKETIKTAETEG